MYLRAWISLPRLVKPSLRHCATHVDPMNSTPIVSPACSKLFGVCNADPNILEDPKVCAIMTTVSSLVIFKTEYKNVQPFMNETSDLQLAPKANEELPEHLEGITIRGLSERLHDQVNDYSLKYATALNRFQLFYGGSSLSNVHALLCLSDDMDGEPVAAEELQSVLGITDLNASAQVLCSEPTSLIADSRLLFHNINKHASIPQKVKELLSAIEDKEKEIADADKALMLRSQALTAALEEQVKMQSKKLGLEKSMTSKEEYVNYLNSEMSKNDGNLRDAQKRLKDYTYRMYGLFVEIWKRDVALAREQVEEFERQRKELEQKIIGAKEGTARNVDDEMHGIVAELARCNKEATTAQESYEESNKYKKELQKELSELRTQLKEECSKEDAVGAQHLSQMYAARDSFAEAALQNASTVGTMTDTLKGDVSLIATMMNKMMNAKTLDDQKKIFEALVKRSSTNDIPMVAFFRKARPLGHIGDTKTIG